MNERLVIERINKAHPMHDGCRPGCVTPQQQKSRIVIGRLLLHANKRKHKWQGKWRI
jgi:hypothetical protein